jgi:hypothetical protein
VHDGGLFGHDMAPVSVWVEGVTNFAALVTIFRSARLRSFNMPGISWRSVGQIPS